MSSFQQINIFEDDAFSMTALTAAINNIDHIPGQAGHVIFTQLGENTERGVETLDVSIESQHDALTLIKTSAHEAPAEKDIGGKRKLRSFHIPQIKLEDTLLAAEFANTAQFSGTPEGSFKMMRVEDVISRSLQRMTHRHDYTLEFHRLGALKGKIRDADGSVLLDLFQSFEILNSLGQPEPEAFEFNLSNSTADVRLTCQAIKRAMYRAAKMTLPKEALVWSFAGDNFFDALISHRSVKRAVAGVPPAAKKLAGNYAFSAFEFGGIVFENYRGSDDESTINIDPDEAIFFFANVPQLYAEYYAPATFLDTVNAPGLPRYARVAFDKRFNESAELHTQQNPLPLCLRPQTLGRGVASL